MKDIIFMFRFIVWWVMAVSAIQTNLFLASIFGIIIAFIMTVPIEQDKKQ